MSNPDKGQFEAQLGGKSHQLQIDNNAIRCLEESLGYGVAYLLGNFQKIVGIDFVTKALHAGLQYDGAPLQYRKQTLARIVKEYDPANFETDLEKIVKAILAWKGIDMDEASPDDQADGVKGPPSDPA